MTKQRATLELVFAGVLWGFGFVATVWALEVFSTPEVLTYRFLIAIVVGEALALIFHEKFFSAHLKKDFIRAAPAGLLLAGQMLFQTWGLQHTTATKSSIITVLYVILVPIINSWFFKKSATWKNYGLASLAVVGTFILINGDFEAVNLGDLLTLAAAVFAAFHIIYIGATTHRLKSPFRFNNFQSFWCLMGLLPFLLSQEKIHFQLQNTKAWIGVLAVALGSSLIAFYLQVRTQRVLSDSTASMIFLLESPFAAFFGFLILSERLSPFQLTGAVIILLAALLQILSERDTKTIEATTR